MLVRVVAISLSIFILLIGLLVLLRNTQKVENRIFMIIAVFSALWGITFQNIEQFDDIAFVEAFNIAAYVFGLLLMFSCVWFTYHFPAKRKTRSLFIYTLILLPTLALSFTPLVAGGVEALPGERAYEFTYGALTPLYNLVMAGGVALIGINLFRKRAKLNIQQRDQARTVAWGFILSFIGGVGLSTVLPLFNENTPYDDLAPFSLVFLIGFTAFAITKHKLFDFRLVIVRSLAYALTLGSIIAIYAAVVFGAFAWLGGDAISQTAQQLFYLSTAVLLSFLFPPVKKFFDKQTNRLFYRDAYDTQTLLNEFNQVLVSTINLTELLRSSSNTIENYLKPEFCDFAIFDAKTEGARIISSNKPSVTPELLQEIQKLTSEDTEKVFATDYLDETANELNKLLVSSNIGMMAKISKDTQNIATGYIILGYKKSGNSYNKQDTEVIEILANELAIAIQNALQFEEIQKFNVTLQEKVDDATKRLRQTNEKLKALDETKDEFISMASHQLRTPLTSVKGYLSMVLEGDTGKVSKSQEKLLDQAFTSSQRMVYLIADLLNVSRLRTGKFVIESVPMNLATAIEGEIGQLTETAKGRGLELTYDKPADFPTLMLDETKIRQVVMNFIDNAIYYTPSGGHIRVSLKDLGSSIEFTVVDDGLGVPKADQHHLFNKFYRAGNARKARPDGTGLGLFMAKKVVVAQGGSIIFKSTEGKGSTFGFAFSKAKLMPPANGEAKTIRTSTAVRKPNETTEAGKDSPEESKA